MKWIAATAVIALVLCAGARPAAALNRLEVVTRESQARQGLEFTLVAERVSAEAVLVRMEIPRKGKLKDLYAVRLRLGPLTPRLAAPLETIPGSGDSRVVSFQISPELAAQCSIDLDAPAERITGVTYAVALKGYVTDRK